MLSGTAALYVHVLKRRVRLVQEIEGFKDDEARDDRVGRGNGRDVIARHFCVCQQWVNDRTRDRAPLTSQRVLRSM